MPVPPPPPEGQKKGDLLPLLLVVRLIRVVGVEVGSYLSFLDGCCQKTVFFLECMFGIGCMFVFAFGY